MSDIRPRTKNELDRRSFLRTAGAGLAGTVLAPAVMDAQQPATSEPITHAGVTRALTEKEKVARIASNSYPIRWIFKNRGNVGDQKTVAAMKQKYGEITTLDFPAYTKKTFPGVTKMDIWSSLFGDADDESQFEPSTIMGYDNKPRQIDGIQSSQSEREEVAGAHGCQAARRGCVLPPHLKQRTTGYLRTGRGQADCRCRCGEEVAGWSRHPWRQEHAREQWRASDCPMPQPNETSYPKNPELEKYMDQCIQSFKEMAEYGAQVGVKVTLENHWGLTANPINIRTIIEEVNNPYCEASPDFCNWEHKYLLYHALNDLAPYRTHDLPREVLGSMGQARRAAKRSHHAQPRLYRCVCPGV